MATSVLIPFGGDCPHRRAALDWLLPRFPDSWEVVVGYHDGPWCKAAAVADALHRSRGDVLVIHDADVWCSGTVATVEECETWAMPHRSVHRLTPEATQTVLAGAEPHRLMAHSENVNEGTWGGGIVAVRRDIYEACPLDPRFVRWGQEDKSWGTALDCLFGPARRGSFDLFHLHHPPEPRLTRAVGSDESKSLWQRYYALRYKPDDMRRLLEEVTACPTPSTS